ncbi:hypothetical protein B4U37_07350 [Sutcliffiella horikoshii]|uniref:Uncharacterized protein n=1 Tax=Sutcliffiella horikoshii TaxID=79883 RepID=A0ABM6KH75_9BACI|nr:hypothetical protein [Sutcliffiella horikoshii]ART75856.1 hypothetical protein B4U37_07350 [Sutcliffiella horikoshii]
MANVTQEEQDLQYTFHRKTAINLFNEVWDLMEKTDRTSEEDFQMIHKAHASRFHWGKIGEPVNFSRGEWQISRVYAVLRRAEPCLVHAKRNLEIVLEHDIKDFDLAFAYEALARAYSISGDAAAKEKYLNLAKEASAQINKDADRNVVLGDLETIE